MPLLVPPFADCTRFLQSSPPAAPSGRIGSRLACTSAQCANQQAVSRQVSNCSPQPASQQGERLASAAFNQRTFFRSARVEIATKFAAAHAPEASPPHAIVNGVQRHRRRHHNHQAGDNERETIGKRVGLPVGLPPPRCAASTSSRSKSER